MMESSTGLRPAARSSTVTRCPSLPAEIWRLIFSVGHFDVCGGFWSTYDHPTMASICCCCTLFCDLVRPRLYCNFDSHVFTDDWHYFSVAKFAWTICSNPRLASMVRHVNIRGACDMLPEQRVTAADDTGHPMASVLINKAAQLGMDFKYYEAYTSRHSGAVGFDLVALVLAQIPLLDTLNLFWFNTDTTARMPEPRDGWPWIRSLRTMFLKPCSAANPISYRHTPSFSACYSLTRILPLLCSGGSLTSLSLFGSTGPFLALPLENLREAILTRCQFYPYQLRNLLQHCRRLRKFVYKANQLSMHTDHSASPSGLEVINALEPAHGSLEVLGMDFRLWPGPLGRRIPSLTQFAALKILYTDLTCVWDQQAGFTKESPPSPDLLFTTLLPESIEQIALFGAGPHDDALGFKAEDHIMRLASDRKEKGRFQQLRKLHGQGFWPFGYDLKRMSLANEEIVRRITAFYDAQTMLRQCGVEVMFDEQGNSGREFGDVITWY